MRKDFKKLLAEFAAAGTKEHRAGELLLNNFPMLIKIVSGDSEEDVLGLLHKLRHEFFVNEFALKKR